MVGRRGGSGIDAGGWPRAGASRHRRPVRHGQGCRVDGDAQEDGVHQPPLDAASRSDECGRQQDHLDFSDHRGGSPSPARPGPLGAGIARAGREVHGERIRRAEREPDGVHAHAGVPGSTRTGLLVRRSQRQLRRITMTRRFVSTTAVVSVAVAALAMAVSPEAQTNTGSGAGASVATPRTPDGKPDLSGMWVGGAGGGGGRAYEVDAQANITDTFPSRRCAPTQVKCSEYSNQSYDGEFTGRMNPNRPLYKPEHWDRVQYLDMNTNTEDPLFICQ